MARPRNSKRESSTLWKSLPKQKKKSKIKYSTQIDKECTANFGHWDEVTGKGGDKSFFPVYSPVLWRLCSLTTWASISGPHMLEREKWLLQGVLWPLDLCNGMQGHATSTANKQVNTINCPIYNNSKSIVFCSLSRICGTIGLLKRRS